MATDCEDEVYGKLKVSMKKLSNHGDIIERRLEVTEADDKSDGREKIVTILQLTSWSLDDIPHPSAILSLVDLLSKTQRSCPSKHTIIMCRSSYYNYTLSLIS